MVLFCSGAVTIASNVRPRRRRWRCRADRARSGRWRRPACRPARARRAVDARPAALAAAISSAIDAYPRARSASKSASPSTVNRTAANAPPARQRLHGQLRSHARRLAGRDRDLQLRRAGGLRGSGHDCIIAALAELNGLLHVGGVAQFAQPVGVGLFRLALTDRLTCRSIAATEPSDRGGPAPESGDSRIRCDRVADLTVLQAVHGALEFRHGLARADPAEIAALRRRTILRVGLRELREVAACGNLTLDFEQLLTRSAARTCRRRRAAECGERASARASVQSSWYPDPRRSTRRTISKPSLVPIRSGRPHPGAASRRP